MILERRSQLNVFEIKEEYGDLLKQMSISNENFDGVDELLKMVNMLNVYSGAMNEISTKLEILDSEFQTMHKHNPIHHIERRVKNLRSIVNKMRKKNLTTTSQNARDNIFDIAGVRVICNYQADVYHIAEMLIKQEDIQLLEQTDYIAQPKSNGYRSLHLVLTVPVFLTDGVENVPVEIQLRTIGMDMWASLEHKLNYKTNQKLDDESYNELIECSTEVAKIEKKIQGIFDKIQAIEEMDQE